MKKLLSWQGWANPWIIGLGIAGSAALATAIVLWTAAFWGPGANSDGLAYLILTRGLSHWHGYGYPRPGGTIKPMAHFPPGYPLALAAFTALGMSPESAALWVNGLSYAALIGFTGWAMYRATRHAWPVVGLTAWLAVAYAMLHIYSWVLSETLFIAWLFFIDWALARWQEKPSSRRALLLGLSVGWLPYIRWVGLAAWGWVAIVMGWTWWQRRAIAWREAAAAALGGGLPPLLLMAANHIAAGVATNRRILWHSPNAAKWQQAEHTLAEWLFGAFQPPKSWAGMLAAVVVLGSIALVIGALRRSGTEEMAEQPLREAFQALTLRWGVFIGVYAAALVAAITLVDAATPMDWRLLAPLFAPASLVAGAAAWRLIRPRPALALAITAVWAAFLVFNLAHDHDAFFDQRWGGVALRSFRWQQAKIWEDIAALPPNVTVLSNELEPALYYTHRPVQLLEPPLVKDGRLYIFDASTLKVSTLPYASMAAWGKAVARQWEGRCAVVAYITLRAPENPGLEEAFHLLKREKSGLLLAPPGGEACLGQ